MTSLDIANTYSPDICCDILEWSYEAWQQDSFDYIAASLPCEQFSVARTTAKTPRNLALADSLVCRTFEIICYFKPKPIMWKILFQDCSSLENTCEITFRRCVW